MFVPGSNLLGIALGVIGSTEVQFYKATGRTQNAARQWVTQFATGEPIQGSWQPVDRTKYEFMGLDLSKSYYMFYTFDLPIVQVLRDQSPDQLEVSGRRYSACGDVPWRDVDGWMSAMFVDIGPAL